MTTKRCTAKTKAGRRCRAYPLEGTSHCLAHSDAEKRESVGFVAANGKGGRKPLPTPTAMASQLMLDSFLLLHGPHFRTLGLGVRIDDQGVASLYELPGGGAKLHGTSQRDGEINMSEFDDLEAQRRAANDLLDRHFGRPKQQTVVTGADGGAVLLRIGELMTPETARLAGELADRLSIEDAQRRGEA